MARISDSELSQLKTEISIERLATARGIELRKHGASDLIGRCPFHDDKTPSLVISPQKNLWHCLGACDTGGSVIDWTMKCEGVSFRHAVELLRFDAGRSDALPKGRNGAKVAKHSTTTKLSPPINSGADDAVLLSQVVDYYHQALKESPEALSYLAARGLKHPDLIDTFKLGFANRTLGYRLPKKTRQAGAEMRSRLSSLGILRESGHEHFNGSIVVPIFGEDGCVKEMYGRKITKGLRKGTPLHLYLPGPHEGIFNWQALLSSEHMIVCESIIDAMTLWCAGFRNVTASYGTGGFTSGHLEAFKRHGIAAVTIAYDRDAAGQAATEKLAALLIENGIDVYGAQFPKGMDANEYALKVQPADKALGLVIRKAVWLGAGQAPEKRPQEAEAMTTAEEAREVSAPRPAMTPPPKPQPSPKSSPDTESFPPLAAPPPGGEAPTEPAVDMQESDRELRFAFGDRRVRIRGLEKNRSYDQLKVNVLIGYGDAYFVDTVDLYAARHRAAFLKQAADELAIEEAILKKDLGRVLLKLEALQEAAIEKALAPKELQVVLSEDERDEALALLKDPNLLSRILADFEACGVVGEESNKLAGYIACVSRKLERPLALIVQSTSAAGKSALMESVLAFLPKEERIKYSAMTGQSLYYLGEQDLKHKVLAVVEEEGAERASYALKLLQSEGELTIASTGKDPQTGKLVTSEYHVEGPVMLFLTTTAIEIDEELLNRCLILSVDEGAAQTAAIHKTQRHGRTLEGLLGRKRKSAILTLHQNAQRLIRSLAVVNPFAEELTFSSHKTRMRRDHMKYLSLIDSITLLHQHQREIKTVVHEGCAIEYIEVIKSDIEVANRLAKMLLGRSLDELPPQTRRLLGLVKALVTAIAGREAIETSLVRFRRRELRDEIGWGNTQLKVHLARLVEMEYLVVHRAPSGNAFLYELCVQADEMISDALLETHVQDGGQAEQSSSRSGQKASRSAPGRASVGPWPGGGRPAQSDAFDAHEPHVHENGKAPSETAHQVGLFSALS